MILKRCRKCKRERSLSDADALCPCGSTETIFKAVVIIPGSGGRRRSKTSPTMEGAREAEKELQKSLPLAERSHQAPRRKAHQNPRQNPTQEPTRYPTVHQVWKAYHSYSRLRKASWKADRIRYSLYLEKPLGHLRASQVRVVDIQSIVDGCILKGLKPATAMQVFALVRVIFNHADRFELTPEGMPNPWKKVQAPKFDNRQTNPLTGDDRRKLEETCALWKNRHAARVVLFCMFTGRRLGEFLKLRWDSVDIDRAMVTFKAETTKSGRVQTVPVNEKALGILREAKEEKVSSLSLLKDAK